MNWEKYSQVIRSKKRIQILESIELNPLTPSQIAHKTGFYISHVSNILNLLERLGIVQCLTPEVSKGKLFISTDLGKNIINQIKKTKKNLE